MTATCLDPNDPPTPDARLRAMTADDWTDVRRIYAEGVATRNATFETEPPAWPEWDRTHLPAARFVATDDAGRILGWAALTRVSDRCVYAGVAEVSVYVAAEARGRGIGRALLENLVAASEADGLWTIQAAILAENAASLALHEACGFRRVGVRERIGQMDGQWRDVVLLERRSTTIGG